MGVLATGPAGKALGRNLARSHPLDRQAFAHQATPAPRVANGREGIMLHQETGLLTLPVRLRQDVTGRPIDFVPFLAA